MLAYGWWRTLLYFTDLGLELIAFAPGNSTAAAFEKLSGGIFLKTRRQQWSYLVMICLGRD